MVKKGIISKRYSFVAKMPKKYSSEDLEKFYFDYHTEWMPRGMSVQAYCSRNNLPDKVLDKWIRDIYKSVVPVQVTGIPKELKIESPQHTVTRQETNPSNENVSIKINISTSSGMELCKDGLDYRPQNVYRKTGGPAMLNIRGMNRFYYIRNFTDMRYKYTRILAVIRHQLGREPEREKITYKID